MASKGGESCAYGRVRMRRCSGAYTCSHTGMPIVLFRREHDAWLACFPRAVRGGHRAAAVAALAAVDGAAHYLLEGRLHRCTSSTGWRLSTATRRAEATEESQGSLFIAVLGWGPLSLASHCAKLGPSRAHARRRWSTTTPFLLHTSNDAHTKAVPPSKTQQAVCWAGLAQLQQLQQLSQGTCPVAPKRTQTSAGVCASAANRTLSEADAWLLRMAGLACSGLFALRTLCSTLVSGLAQACPKGTAVLAAGLLGSPGSLRLRASL